MSVSQLARGQRSVAAKESITNRERIVNAILPKRVCRIRFTLDHQLIHVSPEYNSGNTWAKIIEFVRTKRGGCHSPLPKRAVAIPQVFNDKGWSDVEDY